jgi:ABC-2 type transport system ATP-binding protein
MNAIETHSLTKQYGSKTALKDLNLSIHDGELFGLLGVNGAGKTTAIKLLSCLMAPTFGSATVYGHDIITESHKARSLLATSPQETAVAPNLSTRENLELMAGIYGASTKEAKILATEMIERFNMTSIEKTKAKKLSGGWQRRLSIAMALISEPKLLFLDEPTLGLDILARRELWTIIRQLKGKTTIILTTHYLEEAEALSDRIGILVSGQLTALGTAQELMEKSGTSNFEDAFITLAGGAI